MSVLYGGYEYSSEEWLIFQSACIVPLLHKYCMISHISNAHKSGHSVFINYTYTRRNQKTMKLVLKALYVSF